MKRFEILDISADAGIRVFGKDLPEVFVNAAAGMYSLITDPVSIKAEKSIEVSVMGHSIDGLLVAWLNELIFLFDTSGFIGKEIVITETTPALDSPLLNAACRITGMEDCSLKALLSGGVFDPERHEANLLLKAATYHRLRIEKINGIWEADVIFDI